MGRHLPKVDAFFCASKLKRSWHSFLFDVGQTLKQT